MEGEIWHLVILDPQNYNGFVHLTSLTSLTIDKFNKFHLIDKVNRFKDGLKWRQVRSSTLQFLNFSWGYRSQKIVR